MQQGILVFISTQLNHFVCSANASLQSQGVQIFAYDSYNILWYKKKTLFSNIFIYLFFIYFSVGEQESLWIELLLI